MQLRTCTRLVIAVFFVFSGFVETVGGTGLVLEFSPDGRWGSGSHSLGVGGPLQLVGAAVLVSGRRTCWALTILGCYILLVSVFGDLPLLFNPEVGGSALASLLANVAVTGGILYWFQSERVPCGQRERFSVSKANQRPNLMFRTALCLAIVGVAFCWFHSDRLPRALKTHRATPATNHVLALPVKLLS